MLARLAVVAGSRLFGWRGEGKKRLDANPGGAWVQAEKSESGAWRRLSLSLSLSLSIVRTCGQNDGTGASAASRLTSSRPSVPLRPYTLACNCGKKGEEGEQSPLSAGQAQPDTSPAATRRLH